MTAQETPSLVQRLQAGKEAARRQRPQRLAEVERHMDQLGAEYRGPAAGRRREIRGELRDLGADRMRLRWGACA